MAAQLPRPGVTAKPPSKCRSGTGVCQDCGAPSNGKARCISCASRNAKRGGPGVCRDCRTALAEAKTHSKRCATCLARDRARYQQRVRQGSCVCCKQVATAGAFCLQHWFKNIGQNYGFNKKNGGLDLLQNIWQEQRGLCAVTGERLLPGFNASLDHITPVSKGGPSTRENLRWVTATVNHMKWDQTDAEFLAMCKVIVDRSTRKFSELTTAIQSRSN